jgi:hypothetical protein
VPHALSLICLQLFIALSIGEFLPNRLVAPLYGTLCPSWPLDEVCAAALSFIFYGEAQSGTCHCIICLVPFCEITLAELHLYSARSALLPSASSSTVSMVWYLYVGASSAVSPSTELLLCKFGTCLWAVALLNFIYQREAQFGTCLWAAKNNGAVLPLCVRWGAPLQLDPTARARPGRIM